MGFGSTLVALWFGFVMVLSATFSFIGGENRSTRRKSPTCRKSLTNFITSEVTISLRKNTIRPVVSFTALA
jgi:hypothetical protein